MAVPPARVLLGFRHRWEQADQPGDLLPFGDLLSAEEAAAGAAHGLEGTVYELRKVVALAADCNPNLLELMACRDQEVRLCTPIGERLRAALPSFLSQKARHTFGGYARSQLARIQTHRRWLLEPPKAPPTRAAFGLPERTTLPRDLFGAAEAAARTVDLDDNLMELMDRERRYRAAQRAWEQYQGWLRSRNPARAALEAAHGYDTKHAAHLVRLLRMGREILEQGCVFVWRGDRDGEELRGIRAGAWSYEALMSWAQEADAALELLLQEGRAVVPAQPDLEALDALAAALMAEGMDAAT